VVAGWRGDLSLALVEYLARTEQAQLVLLDGAPFPERSEWDDWLSRNDDNDETSRTMQRLLDIEGLGASIFPFTVDMVDEAQMCAALRRVIDRFGALHGVFYLNQADLSQQRIADIDHAAFEQQTQRTHRALSVLAVALQGRELDFCLLFSSNRTVLGGVGSVAAASIGQLVDAFARKKFDAGERGWFSVGWEDYGDAPIAAEAADGELCMTADESAEVCRRVVLHASVGHLLVSTANLGSRRAARPAPVERQGVGRGVESVHQRPELASAYEPPRNELERELIAVWQELLGIAKIGIHDNFFELGGHSLLATQNSARLRDTFDVAVPLRTLFENPTVAELAAAVEEIIAAELDEISDEEAQRLLNQAAKLA
jgi:acyl carrier protein